MFHNHSFHNMDIRLHCCKLTDSIGISLIGRDIAGFNILQSWNKVVFQCELNLCNITLEGSPGIGKFLRKLMGNLFFERNSGVKLDWKRYSKEVA